MSKEKNWFRNTKWSKEIEDYFFSKLNKSKSDFHKSQYLNVQSIVLFEHGLLDEALNLCDILLERYSNQKDIIFSAYHLKARIYEQKGDIEKSLENYLLALEKEQLSIYRENVFLTFGLFVLKYKQEKYYKKIIDIYNEKLRDQKSYFKDQLFLIYAIKRIISKLLEQNDVNDSIKMAKSIWNNKDSTLMYSDPNWKSTYKWVYKMLS